MDEELIEAGGDLLNAQLRFLKNLRQFWVVVQCASSLSHVTPYVDVGLTPNPPLSGTVGRWFHLEDEMIDEEDGYV